MANTTIDSDVFVTGTLSARYLTAPSGSITNDSVSGSAAIAATKLVHQFPVRYSVANGTAPTTKTELVHIAHAPATIVAVEVVTPDKPDSSDTVIVDLELGNESTSFASVLSSALTINSSSVSKRVYTPTISNSAVADGDQLQVKLTVSGSTCTGLCVTVWLRENPQ